MFPTTPVVKFATTGAQLNRKQRGHATLANSAIIYKKVKVKVQTTTLQRFYFDERSHFVDFFFFTFWETF